MGAQKKTLTTKAAAALEGSKKAPNKRQGGQQDSGDEEEAEEAKVDIEYAYFEVHLKIIMANHIQYGQLGHGTYMDTDYDDYG